MSRVFSKNLANYMLIGAGAAGLGPFLNGAAGYTFSCWYNATTISTGDFDNLIAGYQSGDRYWILASGNRVYYSRISVAAYPLRVMTTQMSAQTNPTGAWHNYIATADFSADSCSHYHDGALNNGALTQAASTGTFLHTAGTIPDAIGVYIHPSQVAPTVTADQFNGRIAEMAVWNKVLSAGDIAALNQRFCPTRIQPSALTFYWKFNGQGSPEVELRNRKHGTITGTVAVGDHCPIIG